MISIAFVMAHSIKNWLLLPFFLFFFLGGGGGGVGGWGGGGVLGISKNNMAAIFKMVCRY